MTILVINNYPDPKRMGPARFDYLLRTLNEITNEPYTVISFRVFNPSLHITPDVSCLILSGAPVHFTPSEVDMYRTELEYLRVTELPVLGICHGHQLIAKAHGANMLSGDYILGFEKVQVLEPDVLFNGWKRGDYITVREVHSDYVEELPREFEPLATSITCKVEAFKHKSRPLYGVQFHPEITIDEENRVYPDGIRILKNFLDYVTQNFKAMLYFRE